MKRKFQFHTKVILEQLDDEHSRFDYCDSGFGFLEVGEPARVGGLRGPWRTGIVVSILKADSEEIIFRTDKSCYRIEPVESSKGEIWYEEKSSTSSSVPSKS